MKRTAPSLQERRVVHRQEPARPDGAALCDQPEELKIMGSDKAAAILYSVMASAKANQLGAFAYVWDLLVQSRGRRARDCARAAAKRTAAVVL